MTSAAKAAWVFDLEVTAVGKAADRARQLLFWYFARPSLDDSSAIRWMWSISRNIALAFFVVIAVGLGFRLIISKEKAKLESFLPKLIVLIVLCVFSYVLVLGLIQLGDLIMKFFIEKVAGENLFTVTFAGENNESSYKTFLGYRDNSPENIESVKTGLFVVKITTFTYNVIFVILVLRKLFLWFLLIVAPFFPLLFAFPLIKNVGWIWVGVFFQWLFYGPLFSIFLAGLVKIWENGIPFGFDFERADAGDVIFPTAINILYGGPNRVLSPRNTSSYVDTYAEYLIGLIMLWAVMLLPWLLLRIFRDYCCDAIKSLEAVTLSFYNRLGGGASPVSGQGGARLDLPLRKSVQVTAEPAQFSVAEMKTGEIIRSAGLTVSSLADLSRFDIDLEKRNLASQKLEYLSSPVKVSDVGLRQQYSIYNQELAGRAARGDLEAEKILLAASGSSVPAILKLIRQQKEAVVAGETEKIKGKVAGIPLIESRRIGAEDYQRVRAMWTNNYRKGAIPISAGIGSRSDWLAGEEDKLAAVIRMISSADEAERQAGFEKIASILPFMLLGGFTENQVKDYLSTKLEAVRFVQGELQRTISLTEKEIEQLIGRAPAMKTGEMLQSVGLMPSSLREIYGLETNKMQQDQAVQKLTFLASPTIAGDLNVGRLFAVFNQQLTSRSAKGDLVAQKALRVASESSIAGLATLMRDRRPKEVILEDIQRGIEASTEEKERVKKAWVDYYQTEGVPLAAGINLRNDWLKSEVNKLTATITSLSSEDEEKRQAGFKNIGSILPFLVLGGFSREETLDYLDTRLEAANQVLTSIQKGKSPEEVKTESVSDIAKMSTVELLGSIGLKISSLADISKLDINLEQRQLAAEKIKYLSLPSRVSDISLRQKYNTFNQELTSRATKGDAMAEKVLTVVEKMPVNYLMEKLQKQIQKTPLAEEEKTIGELPVKPSTKAVSIEDYEEVKKMWRSNYEKGGVEISDKIKSRPDWLQGEIAKISDTIEMVSSSEAEKKKQGLERLAGILPFLLLGGFTIEEALVYLKAKLEAAKEALNEILTKAKTEKGETVKIAKLKKEEPKTMEIKEALTQEPAKADKSEIKK